MAKKQIKVWVGKTLNGDERSEEAGTLKSLCGKVGISYNTARKRQKDDGSVSVWLVGDIAWEVKLRKIDR